MHFLEPQFQNFLGEDPQIKGGPPLPHGSDKTTPPLSIGIVHRLIKIILKFSGEPCQMAP